MIWITQPANALIQPCRLPVALELERQERERAQNRAKDRDMKKVINAINAIADKELRPKRCRHLWLILNKKTYQSDGEVHLICQRCEARKTEKWGKQ